MDVKIVYSNRKTVSLIVKNGSLTVRAPLGLNEKRILEIVKKHESWISEKLKESAVKEASHKELTNEEIKSLKKKAKEYFTAKTEEIAKTMGLKYGRIKITSAERRFGSCSHEKNICFSYRLMLYPERAREYVIVHELCHLVHMNHSKNFYSLLSKYLPDYKEIKRLLK